MVPLNQLQAALLAIALAATLTAHAERVARTQGIVKDDVFPDFVLQRLDGSELRLSEHTGPQIVVFWATWCPHCRRLMPALVEFDTLHREDGLRIVAVNMRDDGDTKAYARRQNMQFDIVLNGDDLAREVGVLGTPTTFVLDADRRVIRRTSKSDPDYPKLHDAVARSLKGSGTPQSPRG